MILRLSFLAIAATLLPLTLPASAQAPRQNPANDCVLDRCGDQAPRGGGIERTQARPERGRDFDDRRFNDRRFDDRRGGRGEDRRGNDRGYGSTPGRFDFYVLALSWSPTFCGSEAGQRSRQQCAIGANLGFVVHGLWPQFERGSPSYCDERNPPRAALDRARGVFPEEGLARYQWRKHGSCSGLSPSAYYDAVAAARKMVTIPVDLASMKGGARKNPRDIERAFVDANRTLRPGMLAVTCTRGQLQEVRVCMSKDLKSFRPCPEVSSRSCPIGSVAVPPPR